MPKSAVDVKGCIFGGTNIKNIFNALYRDTLSPDL